MDSAMFDLDDIAEDGVFFCSDDSREPIAIDVRMAARMMRELELKPGELLPDEMLQKCIESYRSKAHD